ncbi:MAG TPA: glycosyltransferase [Jiangellales bacterium]|nr:glycosyltransferase [Jiangellales bacterium]
MNDQHPAGNGATAPGHGGRSVQEVVQRVMFAAPSPLAPDDLYAVADVGSIRRERTRLAVEPHSHASTNTFFGRFPASYFQRWTDLRRIDLELTASGSGRIELHATDAEGEGRVLDVAVLDGATREQVRMSAALDRFLDGGSLHLEALTGDGELAIEDVRWFTAAPREFRPTSVVICTFNRADDCLATMRSLGSDPEVLDALEHVYVVDQGTDPVESRGDFDDVVKLFGAKLRYLRQRNLGGAGGFTRGLYEVTETEHEDHANVLFMDDDVLLEPETVLRMTAFANRTTAPTIVGGQMLYLYHPTRLHVGAETVELATLKPGRPVEGALHNVDLTEELPHQRVNAGYNAWWSCLIPAEAVSAAGFPLPVFFQWDDIEYGVRAARHGVPTVTLSGAAVWHADFAMKDWDDWSRYFSWRNSLIASALHGDFDPRRVSRVLGRQLAGYLVAMQYGLAATLLKAVEDFLAGPEVLHDGGVSMAAEIRRLRGEYPDTVRHPATEVPVPGAATLPLVGNAGTPSKPGLVLAKRLAYQLTGRHGGAVSIPARDAKWWNVSLYRTAVVTDAAQDAVRIREFDRATFTRLSREGSRAMLRLAREGADARARWQQALPELTSRDNWARLFASE